MAAPAFERHVPLTAIVYGADGIRFVASAYRPDELTAELAGYIRARCDDALWPDVSRAVRALLKNGQLYAAIALYFARVGERWDEETLEITGILFGDEYEVVRPKPMLVPAE